MAPTIKLSYFNLEAAGEPVRLALALAGVEYTDNRVNFPDWPALKPTTPQGKLPVMEITKADGSTETRSQSMAMVRWVATEFAPEALYPTGSVFDIEEALGVVEDMKSSWLPKLYIGMRPATLGHDAEMAKSDKGKGLVKSMRQKWVAEDLPGFLTFLKAMLAKNGGQFLASSKSPTIVDCVAIPFLRSFTRGHVDHVDTNLYDSHPEIVEYIKRFCALDAIKGRYSDGIC